MSACKVGADAAVAHDADVRGVGGTLGAVDDAVVELVVRRPSLDATEQLAPVQRRN